MSEKQVSLCSSHSPRYRAELSIIGLELLLLLQQGEEEREKKQRTAMSS